MKKALFVLLATTCISSFTFAVGNTKGPPGLAMVKDSILHNYGAVGIIRCELCTDCMAELATITSRANSKLEEDCSKLEEDCSKLEEDWNQICTECGNFLKPTCIKCCKTLENLGTMCGNCSVYMCAKTGACCTEIATCICNTPCVRLAKFVDENLEPSSFSRSSNTIHPPIWQEAEECCCAITFFGMSAGGVYAIIKSTSLGYALSGQDPDCTFLVFLCAITTITPCFMCSCITFDRIYRTLCMDCFKKYCKKNNYSYCTRCKEYHAGHDDEKNKYHEFIFTQPKKND